MNRYKNIKKTDTNKGPVYTGVRYPEIPFRNTDYYVIAQQGDRYDLLAQRFYNDHTLWWIIPIANTDLVPNSLYAPEGQQIRIPQEIESILDEYKVLNR